MSERFTIHLNDLVTDSSYRGFEDVYAYGVNLTGCAVTNGCFDVFHFGHLSLLRDFAFIANRRNLQPVIALNSDVSIESIKGPARPVVKQFSRSSLLVSLEWPFIVVIFDEKTPQRLMDFLKPHVVVKGNEYSPESVIRYKDSEVVTFDMIPGFSTSAILGEK